jgi:peptide/nickel transport system permease protein
MYFFIARRLLYTVPIALGVSIICFSLIHLAPGDPLSAMLPENASPDTIADIRAAYGFDKPVPVQYALWLGKVLTGDLGNSIINSQPVAGQVLIAVGNTMILAALAVALGFLVGTVTGIVAGYHNGRLADRSITGVAITGISVPNYWLGMILIIVFAVNLRVLPAAGIGTAGGSPFALETWRHALLPALSMSVIPAGIISRSVRGAVAEVLRQEYVQTLHGKGLRRRKVFLHVVKNASPTAMAIMGLQFAQLLGGSILVETVFSWPGAGFLLNAAIFTRDLPLLLGTILVLAMFFVVTNLLVDILQLLVDPRLKRA